MPRNAQPGTGTVIVAVVNKLLARLWRIAAPLQGRFLWLVNAKFDCGVTGVIRDADGRVLLLRHRFWDPAQQWGFPGGFAKRGEHPHDTVVREVREETGLEVSVGRLLMVRRACVPYRLEIYYEVIPVRGLEDAVALDSREILEARVFGVDQLPAQMPDMHRELAARRPGSE